LSIPPLKLALRTRVRYTRAVSARLARERTAPHPLRSAIGFKVATPQQSPSRDAAPTRLVDRLPKYTEEWSVEMKGPATARWAIPLPVPQVYGHRRKTFSSRSAGASEAP